MSMWEPFTERARRSVVMAQEEAQRLGNNYMGTEHLLLGIVREGESIAAKVLATLGVDLAKVRAEVEFLVGRGGQTVQQEMVFTPRAKRVIELAFEEARTLNHNYIGTEHLLLAVAREGEGVGARVLANLEVDSAELRKTIVELLKASGPETVPSGPPTAVRVRSHLADVRTTTAAAHAILAAKEAAMRAGRRIFDAEHLLFGIAHVESSAASRILAEQGVSADGIRQQLGSLGRDLELDELEVEPSGKIHICFARALTHSESMSRALLDPETLLYSLTDGTEPRVAEILNAMGANVDRIRFKLKEYLDGRNA
jgi:ATP-dependent Clp protease ATP-binding subunit ClpA